MAILNPGKQQLSDDEWLERLKVDYPPIAEMVVKGYIAVDLTPLKCTQCEGTEFEHKNIVVDFGFECEYDVVCRHCHKELGHWAYGNFCL